MNALAQQRCLNHAGREAVARCPGCRRFFCRECVAEHDGRILCASCLAGLVKPIAPRTRRFPGVLAFLQCLLAVGLAWFFFFLIGKGLLAIPTSFHEGTMWEETMESASP